MNIDINKYLDDWMRYFIDCELRCKGRAKLNNDAKRKLRQFHLEQYLKRTETPFAFLFTLKFKHANLFKHISCANQLYKQALIERARHFDDRAGIKRTYTPPPTQARPLTARKSNP